MQAFFLEKPLFLIPVVLLIQLVLVSHALRSRTRNARRLAFGGAAHFALLIVLQAWVKTDRERIADVCHVLARSVEQADVNLFSSQLAADVTVRRARGEPWDRVQLVERFKKTLEIYRVEDSRLPSLHINPAGDRAEVELRANCRLIGPAERYPSLLSRWSLEFQKQGGQWKLSGVNRAVLEPVGVDLLDQMR